MLNVLHRLRITILTLIGSTYSLELQSLKTNPGIAPIKLGTAVMRINSWTIFKTLDLELLINEVDVNFQQYSKLNITISSNIEYKNQLGNSCKQIESFESKIRHRINQILPFSRSKRALFSPLGSVIKSISGNLDETDAIRYDLEIRQLKNAEHSVERKVSLMVNSLDKFANLAEITNSNINILSNKTIELESVLERESKRDITLSLMNNLFQISNNFHIIYDFIQETETAIAFSKLHVLHQSIINSTELIHILSEITKHAHLIYPVDRINLIKIELNIILKSYIVSNKLVFVLEVPLIEPSTYNYYKVIPIPIHNHKTLKTTTIIPKHPYLVVNRLKYRPVANACEEIEDNKFLCSSDDLVPYATETCIEQIMMLKENYTKCHQNVIQIEKEKIQRITENYWLIYTENNLIVTEYCNEEVNKHTIQGTFFLQPKKQCRTEVGDIFIPTPTNTSMNDLQTPFVPLPELRQPIREEERRLDLQNVDFSDIRDVINSANHTSVISQSDQHASQRERKQHGRLHLRGEKY
ncbi:uncharacterized protein LOC133534042 [Cydia pomonella]|uniref:uncharacterized protein LOC133534042 n=1 Tax=Cydia pomonella TaxID=82600 RepID=UPI002ADDBF4D|nr:uncharacterized protein LOC133534042 [Cydia pomonella]